MALDDIIGQVAAVLGSVSGIGTVHEYERFAAERDRFLDLFAKTDQDGVRRINGWTIRQVSTAKRQVTLGEKELAHVLVIRGRYSLKDEEGTERTFQDLLDAIALAFDGTETLGDTCLTINPDWGPMQGDAGIQIVTVDTRVFSGVLCHHAELRLCAVERWEE